MKQKLPSELTRVLILVRPFKIRKYLKNHPEPKLHIGCGPQYREGWLNADKFDSRADIYMNGYNRMPFKDNTFNYLYSEHTLEHLRITKVKFFLEECRRVLKPGGIFRVTIPDLELMAQKYVEKDYAYFQPYLEMHEKKREDGNPKYWLVRTPGAILNTIATRYFFHHRWFYDFKTLELCCKELGFQKVEKCAYNQSEVDLLANMDRETRKRETLYVELTK
ncbi:MAG: methyltransferase domain-containing protein [Bacteroidota bacterium]